MKRRTYDQCLYQKAASRPGRGFTFRSFFDSPFQRYFGITWENTICRVTEALCSFLFSLFFFFLFTCLNTMLQSISSRLYISERIHVPHRIPCVMFNTMKTLVNDWSIWNKQSPKNCASMLWSIICKRHSRYVWRATLLSTNAEIQHISR